jgi:hypothetical protein
VEEVEQVIVRLQYCCVHVGPPRSVRAGMKHGKRRIVFESGLPEREVNTFSFVET